MEGMPGLVRLSNKALWPPIGHARPHKAYRASRGSLAQGLLRLIRLASTRPYGAP